MAFDGFTTAALTRELHDLLEGGRVYRIIQPARDTLLLTIKPMITKGGGQIRLYLSADPSLPLVYLTSENKPAPDTAPAFCMLLRKYLQNGRILRVTQPGLERIIEIDVEHMNEMGDLETHALVIELMGKHSNIIFLSPDKEVETPVGSIEDGTARMVKGPVIVDAIRRVSGMVSSVREVLPGRAYFVPETKGKIDPLTETHEGFLAGLRAQGTSAARYLVSTYIGFSTLLSEELAARARLSQDRSVSELTEAEGEAFWQVFQEAVAAVQAGDYHPTVYYRAGREGSGTPGDPVDYSVLPLTIYADYEARTYETISALIENYYRDKNTAAVIRQKSADLRKIVTTILERDVHKYDLQMRQMKDTDKRDKYRIYGELLNAYGYSIPEGASSVELDNYYTGEKVKVTLDPTKSASENAVRYYERYTKLKRTREALETLTQQVHEEIMQLENIKAALDIAETDGDLRQIRKEMEDSGFLKAHPMRGGSKRIKQRNVPEAQPLHYVSSDGYDIYVGKNNIQNDALTFHMAEGRDIWFHANDIPGSHVILRTGGRPMEEIPDRAFIEAAQLAAYYSKGRSAGRVEVDYLERRNVKKPSGSRPGFVVYYTNYSINVDAVTGGLTPVD